MDLYKKAPSGRLKWLLYVSLLLLRFILVFCIQPGYLHPDEFFQSVEVGAGDVYNLEVHRTWEFDSDSPLRSIAGIGPLVHLPIWLYKRLVELMDGKGQMLRAETSSSFSGNDLILRILLPVRLISALLSCLVDAFILFASYVFRSNKVERRPNVAYYSLSSPPIGLLLYASSAFGGLIWAGRSIANNWETSLVSFFSLLSLFIYQQICLGPSSSTHRPHADFKPVFLVMSIQAVFASWALFVRLTFGLFILPIALYEVWIVSRRLNYMAFVTVCGVCVALCATTIQFCLLVDTNYYQSHSSAEAFHLPRTMFTRLSELLCCPCNFLRYNADPSKVSRHGFHPFWLHAVVNLPLLLGPLVFILFPSFLSLNRSRFVSLHDIFCFSILLPLSVLSYVPHQEARFLMPTLPFCLVLVGFHIEMYRQRWLNDRMVKCILYLWLMQQLVLSLLFGVLHQGGLLPYLSSLQPPSSSSSSSSSDCFIHIFRHTYMPPRFPFNIANTARDGGCNVIEDLYGDPYNRLLPLLNRWSRSNPAKNQTIHLIYPGSSSILPLNLTDGWKSLGTRMIPWHLSMEHLPHLWPVNFSQSYWDLWQHWRSQMSLHIHTIVPTVKQKNGQ